MASNLGLRSLLNYSITRMVNDSCADPDSFVRGDLTLITFLEGRENPNKYHFMRAIIDQPVKRHSNGVSLACRY